MLENRMYDEMKKAARQRLEGKDPEKIAENAGVIFRDDIFHFRSLGQEITVSYPGYDISPSLEEWYQLVILHYLEQADGVAPAKKEINFAEQKSGLVRGGGFDRSAEKFIEQKLGKMDPEILYNRCMELGCVKRNSKADLCVEIPFLPNYPMVLNMWFADEEFPASGRLLINESAEHYLSVEDSVTAGELVLKALAWEE